MRHEQHQAGSSGPPDASAAHAAREPAGRELLSIRVRDEPAWTRVSLAGELDLAAGGVLERHLREAQSRTGWIVLDLRALTFIDCTGLRSVLAGRRRATERGHRFEVLCVPGQVARMLSVSGVDQMVDVVQRPAPAVMSIGSVMKDAA